MIEIINIHYLISLEQWVFYIINKPIQMKTLVAGVLLYQPKYKNDVLLVDGAREIMGLALNKLGYSLNDTNPNHLKEAEKDLHHLAPQVRGVVGDEVTMMLEQNEGISQSFGVVLQPH